MTPAPEVQPLPYKRRKYLFSTLFVVFLFVLPALMFYATGYRFDFSNDTRNIISTGGMYVSAGVDDAQIYVDEEPVNNIRVFRSASYIQNLNAGIHRLTVQHAGLQTWTKDLPVFPHIVTEAQAFNMPIVPQVRLITPYLTQEGASVVFVATTSEQILPFASTTNPIHTATSTATSTYQINAEYEYVASLFSTSSATSSSLVARVAEGVESAFSFATTASATSVPAATSTKTVRNATLYKEDEEVYIAWNGSISSIPYYYCVDHVSASSTIARYGEHVYASIAPILASSTEEQILQQNDRTRVCRREIRIDRKWQDVQEFDFFPGSTDLVLMLLADGLYVVEVDDRSWQNTQLLYPGTDLRMVIDGGRIYVRDGERYVEVLTERAV